MSSKKTMNWRKSAGPGFLSALVLVFAVGCAGIKKNPEAEVALKGKGAPPAATEQKSPKEQATKSERVPDTEEIQNSEIPDFTVNDPQSAKIIDGQPYLSFSFDSAEITEVIRVYAEAARERFLVEPRVRGKVTIITHAPVRLDEAYHLMSSALARLGFAIVKKDGFSIVLHARGSLSEISEVVTYLPDIKPERILTYVVKLHNFSADDFFKNFRAMVSSDGDMRASPGGKQLIITDWVSSLYRIDKILQEVDKPSLVQKKDSQVR